MQRLKGSYLLWGVLLLAVLSGGILVQTYFYPAQPASAWPESQVCWVIDPGHGGEDGGAVSLSGEKESLINLEICRRLDLLLAFCGQQTRMLREEDISLHDSSAQTLREKKVSDLKNRAALASATPNGVLLSIHQNTFPQSQYHGAQVFFGAETGSEALAQAIQGSIIRSLDPENQRQAKPVADTIYLMNHVTCPAVLVECGFLSNPQEEENLRSDAYQKALACAITAACLEVPSPFQA